MLHWVGHCCIRQIYLLLDEPLSALDAAHKQEILPFFQTVQHETHIPMLYVSHDMDEIKQLTEAVWLL